VSPTELLGLITVAVAVTFSIVKVLGPIGAAIGHRIRGGRDNAPDQHLVAEVDELRTRLAEVEERLDFAERLLAQPQQPARSAVPVEGGSR
jgi:hypothetical protein